jgi:hypothetical protein
MKDRDQRYFGSKRLHVRSLKSDPTSPIEKNPSPSPLDLRRALSGRQVAWAFFIFYFILNYFSQRNRLRLSSAAFSSAYNTPQSYSQQFHFAPQTAPAAISSGFPSSLGVDIAVEALRRRQQISAQR